MIKVTKFVIVGTQRTGTTLIRTTLGDHPDIVCHGEVFKLGRKPYREEGGYWSYSRRSTAKRVEALALPARSTSAYLNDLFDTTQSAAVGFKLMLSHCQSRPYIWPMLSELGVSAIWVRRANVLKTLVSRRTAAASGVYHVAQSQEDLPSGTGWQRPDVAKDRSIQLDTGTLLQDLKRVDEEQQLWREKLRDSTQYLELVYEDYIADKDAGNEAMLDFLGVPRVSVASGLHKVNPDKLAQLIRNYDQVLKVLRGSDYAYCLD